MSSSAQKWDIHLSYHPRHQAVAHKILRWLRRKGLKICLVCIIHGNKRINSCIENSSLVLACVSTEYVQSINCMNEIRLAFDRGIAVLGVWIGDHPPNENFKLQSVSIKGHIPINTYIENEEDYVFEVAMNALIDEINSKLQGKIMAETQGEYQDLKLMLQQEVPITKANIAIVGQDCKAKDELANIICGRKYSSVSEAAPDRKFDFQHTKYTLNRMTGQFTEINEDEMLLDFLCYFYTKSQKEKEVRQRKNIPANYTSQQSASMVTIPTRNSNDKKKQPRNRDVLVAQEYHVIEPANLNDKIKDKPSSFAYSKTQKDKQKVKKKSLKGGKIKNIIKTKVANQQYHENKLEVLPTEEEYCVIEAIESYPKEVEMETLKFTRGKIENQNWKQEEKLIIEEICDKPAMHDEDGNTKNELIQNDNESVDQQFVIEKIQNINSKFVNEGNYSGFISKDGENKEITIEEVLSESGSFTVNKTNDIEKPTVEELIFDMQPSAKLTLECQSLNIESNDSNDYIPTGNLKRYDNKIELDKLDELFDVSQQFPDKGVIAAESNEDEFNTDKVLWEEYSIQIPIEIETEMIEKISSELPPEIILEEVSTGFLAKEKKDFSEEISSGSNEKSGSIDIDTSDQSKTKIDCLASDIETKASASCFDACKKIDTETENEDKEVSAEILTKIIDEISSGGYKSTELVSDGSKVLYNGVTQDKDKTGSKKPIEKAKVKTNNKSLNNSTKSGMESKIQKPKIKSAKTPKSQNVKTNKTGKSVKKNTKSVNKTAIQGTERTQSNENPNKLKSPEERRILKQSKFISLKDDRYMSNDSLTTSDNEENIEKKRLPTKIPVSNTRSFAAKQSNKKSANKATKARKGEEQQNYKEIYLILKQTPVYNKFLALLKSNRRAVAQKSEQFEKESFLNMFRVRGNDYYINHKALVPSGCSYLIVSQNNSNSIATNNELAFDNLINIQADKANNFWKNACIDNKSEHIFVHGTDYKNVYSNISYIKCIKNGKDDSSVMFDRKDKDNLREFIKKYASFTQKYSFGHLLIDILIRNEKSQFIKTSRLNLLKRLCKLGRHDDKDLDKYLVENFQILPSENKTESTEDSFVVSNPGKFIEFLKKSLNYDNHVENKPLNFDAHNYVDKELAKDSGRDIDSMKSRLKSIKMKEYVEELCSNEVEYFDDSEKTKLLSWLIKYLATYGLIKQPIDNNKFKRAGDLLSIEWTSPIKEESKMIEAMKLKCFETMSECKVNHGFSNIAIIGDNCRGKSEISDILHGDSYSSFLLTKPSNNFIIKRLLYSLNKENNQIKERTIEDLLLNMLCNIYTKTNVDQFKKAAKIHKGVEKMTDAEVALISSKTKTYEVADILQQKEMNRVKDKTKEVSDDKINTDHLLKSLESNNEVFNTAFDLCKNTPVFAEFLYLLQTDLQKIKLKSNQYEIENYFQIFQISGSESFASFYHKLIPNGCLMLNVTNSDMEKAIIADLKGNQSKTNNNKNRIENGYKYDSQRRNGNVEISSNTIFSKVAKINQAVGKTINEDKEVIEDGRKVAIDSWSKLCSESTQGFISIESKESGNHPNIKYISKIHTTKFIGNNKEKDSSFSLQNKNNIDARNYNNEKELPFSLQTKNKIDVRNYILKCSQLEKNISFGDILFGALILNDKKVCIPIKKFRLLKKACLLQKKEKMSNANVSKNNGDKVSEGDINIGNKNGEISCESVLENIEIPSNIINNIGEISNNSGSKFGITGSDNVDKNSEPLRDSKDKIFGNSNDSISVRDEKLKLFNVDLTYENDKDKAEKKIENEEDNNSNMDKFLEDKFLILPSKENEGIEKEDDDGYIISDPERFIELLQICLNPGKHPAKTNEWLVPKLMQEKIEEICSEEDNEEDANKLLKWLLKYLKSFGLIKNFPNNDVIKMEDIRSISWNIPVLDEEEVLTNDPDLRDFIQMSNRSIGVTYANLAIVGDDCKGKSEARDLLQGKRFSNVPDETYDGTFRLKKKIFLMDKSNVSMKERSLDDVILGYLCLCYTNYIQDDRGIFEPASNEYLASNGYLASNEYLDINNANIEKDLKSYHQDDCMIKKEEKENVEKGKTSLENTSRFQVFQQLFSKIKYTPIYIKFLKMAKFEPSLLKRKALEIEEEDFITVFNVFGAQFSPSHNALLPNKCMHLILNVVGETGDLPLLTEQEVDIINGVTPNSGGSNYWSALCELKDNDYINIDANQSKSLYSNTRHIISIKGRNDESVIQINKKSRVEAKNILIRDSVQGNHIPFGFIMLLLLLREEKCTFVQRKKISMLKRMCHLNGTHADDAERFLADHFYIMLPEVPEKDIPEDEQFIINDPDRFLYFLQLCLNAEKDRKDGKTFKSINVTMREYIQDVCQTDKTMEKNENNLLFRWLVRSLYNYGIVADLQDIGGKVGSLPDLGYINWLIPASTEILSPINYDVKTEIFLTFHMKRFKGNLLFHHNLFYAIVSMFLGDKEIKRVMLTKYCLRFVSYYGNEFVLRLRYMKDLIGGYKYYLNIALITFKGIQSKYACNQVKKKIQKAVRNTFIYCFKIQVSRFYTRYAYIYGWKLMWYKSEDGHPPSCIQDWFAGSTKINTNRGLRSLMIDGGGERSAIEVATLMLIKFVVYLHSMPIEKRKKTSLSKFLESKKKCFHFKKTLVYPKIVELFDVIIGSSTGALIAKGLVRNDPMQILHKLLNSAENEETRNNLFGKIKGSLKRIFEKKDCTLFKKRFEETLSLKGTGPKYPIIGSMEPKPLKYSASTHIEGRRKPFDSLEVAAMKKGWYETDQHFERIIESNKDCDEISNCPIIEGSELLKKICDQEKCDYATTRCLISVGCGPRDKDTGLHISQLDWLAKTSDIFSVDEQLWESEKNGKQHAFRLNPSSVFDLKSHDTEDMVAEYLDQLRDSTTRQAVTSVPYYCEIARYPIISYEIDGITAEYSTDKMCFWGHVDSVNEILVEFSIDIEDAKLVIIGNIVELWFNHTTLSLIVRRDSLPTGKIYCAQSKGNVLKLTLDQKGSYGDVYKVHVEENGETLSYLVMRIDGPRAYKDEIEQAALAIYAKNLLVNEVSNKNLVSWIDRCDEEFGCEEYENMELYLSITCLSQNPCVVKTIKNLNKVEKMKNSIKCSHCMESGQVVNSEEIKRLQQKKRQCEKFPYCDVCIKHLNDHDDVLTGKPKKPVFVDCLTVEVRGENTSLEEWKLENKNHNQIGSVLKLKIKSKKWAFDGFEIRICYKNFDISGSPIRFMEPEQNPGILERYFRNSTETKARVTFISMEDIRKDGSKISSPDMDDEKLLIEFSRSEKSKIIILSYNDLFKEYFIRYRYHVVIPENEVYNNVVYFYDAEFNKSESGYLQEEYRPRANQDFLRSIVAKLRDIERYKTETESDVQKKLYEKLQSKKELNMAYFGRVEDYEFGKVELDIITLSEIYSLKIILLTHDHRKKEYYIKYPHHVVRPRSSPQSDTIYLYMEDIL